MVDKKLNGGKTMKKEQKAVFDFDNLNPGVWFPYKDSDTASICLRVCAGDDIKAIRKQTTKTKVEYKNNQRFTYEDTNDELYRELLWDFCIVDWKGFANKSGIEIPCTKENKLLLMGKSVDFAKFVGDSLEKLNDIDKNTEEDKEKK
jgi:hypothetical protein